MRQLISSGSAFESAIGYSRAVVSDNFVFVSGKSRIELIGLSLEKALPDLTIKR